MKHNLFFGVLALCLILLIPSCGSMSDDPSGDDVFQDNGVLNSASDFEILSIFDGRGALEDIWDSIKADDFNRRLNCTVDNHLEDFIKFSNIAARILTGETQPVAGLLSTDLAHLIDFMMDDTPAFMESPDDIGAFYSDDTSVYSGGFYSFLDKLWEDDHRPGDEQILDMNRKIITWLLDTKTAMEMEQDIQETMDDILDDDFDRDVTLLSSLLGKLMIQADYPIWTDSQGNVLDKAEIDPTVDTNTGTGNAVQGMNTLVNWMNTMMADETSREMLYDTLRESVALFDPYVFSPNAGKLKTLLQNIEDHFTKGGAVYESQAQYKSDPGDPIYDDAELGQSLREFMPYAAQLLARSDRDISLANTPEGQTPHYVLRNMVTALKQIGFNPDSLSIEKSLLTLMSHDLLGRDRTDESSGAFPASMLESLLFLTCATAHFGFADGGPNGEVTDSSDPAEQHGHGRYTEALSLNDSLLSITTNKMLGLGLYDLALQEDDKDYLFRSYSAFSTLDKDTYKFEYNADYPILRTLTSTSSGDYGRPDGGVPWEWVENEQGEQVKQTANAYRPYNPTGKGETQLAAWTVNWAVRSCFGGEGPYYYAPQDNALTSNDFVTVNDKPYTKYYRPDGRVYALVNKDNPTWEYLYPTEEGDAEDPETDILVDYNGKRQRFNRYKSTWHSDYYMYARSKLTLSLDNSDGTANFDELEDGEDAQRLTYEELVPEDDSNHSRACASKEEAFFRNYQWVYTEKKMVLIIPQSLTVDLTKIITDVSVLEKLLGEMGYGSAVLIFEAHGWSGLANMRLLGKTVDHNHRWAKLGTEGKSLIPGDFRVELDVKLENDVNNGFVIPWHDIVQAALDLAISPKTIYETVLGRGHGTPAIVGKNLPALYRLAFPVSPEMTHGTVTDVERGSTHADFEVGDEVWQDRNALAPILVAMLQGMTRDRVEYPEFNPDSLKNGLRGHLNSFAPLVKPLLFHDKDTQVPYDTWKLRVQGTSSGAWDGDPYLMPTGYMVDDPETLSWKGDDDEWAHFQPDVMNNKTLLNMMIDSDITAPVADGKRMDGILPVLAGTHTLTQLFKLLMSDTNNSDDLYSALEQMTSAVKYTEGAMTSINREEGASKPIPFPNRFFATGSGQDAYGFYTNFNGVRDEDIILDIGLDRLLGHNTRDGYGLSAYVAEQEAPGENWADFRDTLDTLEDFLHPDSPYSLLESFIDMQDAIFVREVQYTPEQIRGLIYTLGRLFTRYDTDEARWRVQGEEGFRDLYNILKLRIPAIHDLMKDGEGSRYQLFLTLSRDDMMAETNACGEKGMIPYLLDTMSTDEGAEQVLTRFNELLEEDFVSDPEPMWDTLAGLLAKVAETLEKTKDSDSLETVYQDFGFQKND